MTKSHGGAGKRPASGSRRYDAPDFDLRKLVTKIASCRKTTYVGHYLRDKDPLNPASKAGSYADPDSFKHDYLLYNLVRKFNETDEGTAAVRVDNTMRKFLSVEAELKAVNERLTWTNLALNEPVAHTILYRASRKIERLIGTAPSMGRLLQNLAFSNGATALHPRTEGESAFKYSYEYPEVTPALYPLMRFIISLEPNWASIVKGFRVIDCNRMSTVPKDHDIDRPIFCEPTLNMMYQKGLGAIIREDLLKVRVDLRDQSINQELAREGSISGDLATVDLSAASDSVSLAICKLLLPLDWYHALCLGRSDKGMLLNDTKISFEKISSMGNGFTFELESLIFWAITQACEDETASSRGLEPHRCNVYGDDIVCRSYTVPILKTVLDICGFKFNDDKSYWTGPFRESCGKHFWNGYDVSPVFIRGPLKTLPELFTFMNGFRRWYRRGWSVDDPSYHSVYEWLVAKLPPQWQTARIPDGFGDGALIGPLAEVLPDFVGGVYKASVLSKQRCMVSAFRVRRQGESPEVYHMLETEYYGKPYGKRYTEMCSVYKGLGGFISYMANKERSRRNHVNLVEELLIQERHFKFLKAMLSSIEIPDLTTLDMVSEPLTFARVPIPGAYKLEEISLELYEWTDF